MDPCHNRAGRRSWVSASLGRGLLVLAAGWLGSGCQLIQGGSAPEPEGPVRTADPAIQRGSITPGAQAAAARLLSSARRAIEAGDNVRAAADADRVVTEFPTAEGSATALWILTQAAFANGDFPTAQAAAERFAGIMPPEDRRAARAALLDGRARFEMGLADEAVAQLLASPNRRMRLVESEAKEQLRIWVREVETARLGELVEGVAPDHVLLPPVWIELGVGLHFAGEIDASAQIARLVLASGADPDDREVARSLLTGSVSETLGAGVTVGLIVPASGSPTLQRYAREVEEGVQVALQIDAARSRRPVELSLVDDGGDASLSRRGVRQLEASRTIAIIGPLLDQALQEAALGRETSTAIISPTASYVPSGTQGIYSLAAPDAGGVASLAQYAADQGYQRLALIYPRTANSEWEAQAFVDSYASQGVGRVERFPYEPGATTFIDQLTAARRFGADVLVLPVPDADVELIAPQVTFSGLDTLGVHILGNAAWGEEETLRQIDPRHTNGVVIASPRNPGATSDPYLEFVRSYEELHRKTLRSPVPAFGYDAARLVLNAIEQGARSPFDLRAILERTTDFPGATGAISIVDGRVTRKHYLYEVRDRQLFPTGRRFE